MLRRVVFLFAAMIVVFTNTISAPASSLPSFTALSAEADPHTGSANFGVPIEVPPGRGGIQPNIQLQYNSSAPNDILGVGWNLELGVIQRSSKAGVPHYDDTDTFVLIQNGGVQELVLDAGTGLYRGKVEGSFMKIERTSGFWKVTDKNGIQYFFGETPAAREYDPADSNRVFKWCLNRVEDLHGNDMTVDYFRDENKLYPQDIRYTGNSKQGWPTFAHVAFEREARPEEQIDRYAAGFRMAMRYRIGKITVEAGGNLQRRYDLVYEDSRTTGRSLLTSIVQYGADGYSSLPPVTFSYQTPKNPDFNYNVTPMNNSVQGDNLWNYRYDPGYDRGHENYGPCPPTTMCKGVNWGPLSTKGDGNGNVSFSSGQDVAHWLWTYLYVDKATTLSVPYQTGGVDGVWLNGNYSQSIGPTWPLQPGYNVIEITLYHQHESFGFNLNYALANNVDLMSSSAVVLPQLSGDFNADGRTDVATFTAASGKVEVERSNGTTFAGKETWISGFGANGKLVLGDFNGDGRMDIAAFDPASGNWWVGFSDGSRFNDAGVWLSGFGANEEPGSGDFNGDGLTDILTFYKASGNLYVRIALNKGGSFASLSGGQNILIGSDSDTPVVGDFNGDGQIDFGAFNKSGGNWNIRLNTGDILAGLRQLPTVSGFGAGRNTVVSDFNYDGLTDIGYYDDSTGKVVYRVSTGLSFAAAAELPFVFNIKGPNTQIQSGDYNGDTLIDFAVYNPIGKLEIAFSNGAMPDILSSVENGLGGRSEITYNAAVNYPQTFLPFPIQVVKSITQSNGLGESYTINNSYEQGLWDAQKREFRGFGLVRTTDPDGNYVDTFFAQDGIYKGRVTEQRTYDVLNKLYGKTLHTWAYEEVAAGSNFIYLKRKDNFVYDGDATGRRTAEELFYEEAPQYGNLTRAVQLGEVDLNTGGDIGSDTRSVETSYVRNTTDWLIGLPSLAVVKDNDNKVVRKTWFSYDGQGNTASPVKGLLTKKEDWAGDAPGTVNPVTQYTYDSVGNLLTTTDPRGKVTTVAYDTTYTMFPVTTTNALNHQVVNVYYGVGGVPLDSGDGLHGLWGQLKSTTDPNNQAGKRVYDVFGRTAAAISSLDSVALPTQTTAIEFLGSYTKVTTRQRVAHGKPETIDAVSFIDGFGRLVQTKTRTEVNGRYVVGGQTRYNSRGLKSRQFLPAFSTNPMDVIDVIDTAKPNTLITYDAMGRPVKTTNPDGTFASVSYDDWTTTTTDENGHRQKSYFDAYGRLVKKEEYTGADGRSPYYPATPNYTVYATTQYVYDSEGNLLKTIDAYGNTTTITYDALGRKTAMDDPDMGYWTYTYDLNGNLVGQTDAKGQTLTFTYDALNRLTNKTDGTAALNVNYTYDNATVTNAKGRLTQAAYTAGNTQFAYDELGRELQSVKEINGRAYEIGRNYDALNRLTAIAYPQGENVVYHYNAAGQIETVANDPALTPPPTLAAPELYLIQTGSTELKLSWGSVIDADGYRIKYGTTSGNYATTLDAGTALSKVITGLANDTTYYFVVLAYNTQIQSSDSNERAATPVAPTVITMPSPWIQYAFNDNASNTTVTDTGSGTHQAMTEQTSAYTSDLTGSGTASASSCLWGCGNPTYAAVKAFDNDFTNWDGWVADGTKSGWLAYEFSSAQKINRYVIAPRGHIYSGDDGNPHNWTFEGFNGSGWDVLDSRSYSSWSWQNPVTFNFTNDKAYNKYRLNISSNGGHVEVGLTEMEMMAYAPLYTGTVASPGRINNAFNFNGTGQLVNADSLLDIKNHAAGSISLWLNPDTTSVNGVVFSFGDTDGSNRVEVRAANDLEFYIVNSVLNLRVSLPNALIAGLWSHVVITQDGNGIKGYVNGSEVAVSVLDQGLGLDAWFNSTWGIDNARIGCMKNNNQSNYNYYDGRVDDLRYYDYPLKAAEVKALYNDGAGTEAKNPQYTEYTPLALKSEARSTFAEDGSSLTVIASPVGRSNLIARRDRFVTSSFDEFRTRPERNRRPSFLAMTRSLSNALAWLERHVLGVGEAEAAPAAPVLNTATAGNAKVSLSWGATAATTGYKVKYDTVSGGGAGAKDFTKDVDCVAAWKFNETSGTVTDSCKTNHGTISGTVKRGVAGKYNSGIEFLGYASANNALVNFGSAAPLDNLGARTLLAWINPHNLGEGSKGTIFNKDYQDGWTLRLAANNNIAFSQAFSGGVVTWTTTTNALKMNTWQHVAVTYTSSGTSAVPVIYINGVAQATTRSGTPYGTIDNDAAFNLLFGIAGTTQEFDGVIDEAAIFKRVLTPAEIAGIMNTRLDGGLGMTYTTQVDVGNVTGYTVTGLTNGTTYYFVVSAKDAAGESPNSNERGAIPVAPPVAPVLNTATPGNAQVSLSWSAVTGATGYKVYSRLVTTAYATATDVGSVTSRTVTGLTNGTLYYFVVAAYNAAGQSVYSNEVSAAPVASTSVPAAPVLNTAVPGDAQVSLSWGAVSGAAGYKVKYGTASGSYTTTLDVGNVTGKQVTGLTNGKTYYFVVVAYNAAGTSANSNEKSAVPTIQPFATTLEAEAMPTKTTGGATTGGWNIWSSGYIEDTITFPRSGTYEFEVVARGSVAAGVWPNMQLRLDQVSKADITVNATAWKSFIRQVSVASGSHRVAVAFTNDYKTTTEDRNLYVDKVIIREIVSSPPSAPTLNSPAASDTKVDLSWSAVTGATGYKIYYGTVAGQYGTPISVGNTTTATVTGLTNGTKYYFALSAVNAGGESGKSNEVNATPTAPVTESPTLFVKNVDYNAAGQITKIEYGNGDVTEYTYDALTLRLTRIYTLDANRSTLQDLNYTYDSAGNILSIDDKVNTADQAFQYDELNRLTEAAGQSYGTKTYVYDAIGNIVEKDGKTYFYGDGVAAGPHAVTSLSDGTTFTYDPNGNLTQQTQSTQTTQYTYDAENRLVKVVKNGGTIGQYEYDGDGGRTKKTATVGSQTTTTTFVGSLFETSGARSTKFIFLGDQRVAAVTASPTLGSEVLYYHADHLGGANVLTDGNGTKKELIEYEPFGLESRHEKYGSSEEVAWYYFTGKPKDDETGLIYFGARYYDPSLGRFITADTMVQALDNPQTLNRYSYCGNNPVNRIDPTGHKWSWKKFFGHLLNAVRVVVDIITFPVNPVGSTLDIASVVASYTGGGDSAKVSQILGWSALGWNVGQGIHNALDPKEVQLLNVEGQVVTDYSKVNRVLSTGINTTDKNALKLLQEANKNLSVKYDAIIWNKTHGPLSDFIESGVVKFTGSRTLANEYSKIINNVVSANPAAAFDVHSESTILFTRAFQSLPADSLSQSTVNYFGTAVLESTAKNSFLIPGGGTGTLTFDSRFSDPITSFFGTLNPARMAVGGGIGVATGGAPHNIYGYLSQRYPRE